jgi:lysophospholipase L1-like esterase
MLKQSVWIILALTLFSFSAKQSKQRIVFFGDSITEAGDRSGGFISMMRDQLKEQHKDNQYELLGAGISGNKVYDLYLRINEDVLSKKPDVVVIWVGVNDVWHKRLYGTGTDPDKFDKFYRRMLQMFKERNIKTIICTPACVGEKTDYSNELDGDLNQYSKQIRALAAEFNSPLLDLRTIFHDYQLKNNPENLRKGILTVDGVHLNEKGNTLLAAELSKMLFQ